MRLALVLLSALFACDGGGEPLAPAAADGGQGGAGGGGPTVILPPLDEIAPAKSPTEAWMGGLRRSGAYSIYDEANCPKAAFARHEPDVVVPMPDQVVITYADGSGVTASQLNEWVLADLRRVTTNLGLANDAVAAQRHVCVAPMMTPTGTGGAYAAPQGYLVYDVGEIGRLVNLQGSHEATVRALASHELAHHIQFWHDDRRFFDEPSVRRVELVADCMAGAMLTLNVTDFEDFLSAMGGVEKAVVAWSDTNFLGKQHHGSEGERAQAARIGAAWAVNHRNSQGGMTRATSTQMLKGCEDGVWKADQERFLTPPVDLFGVDEDQ